MAVDPSELISAWWDTYQPDPRAKYSNIISGMRKQLPTTGQSQYSGGVTQRVSVSQQQTGACQYWIRGLSAVCSKWNHETLKCTVEINENRTNVPSGYGIEGGCDFLGRRSWCSGYVAARADNLDEFVCIAPCFEKSGLGKQVNTVSGTLFFRPLLPSEVQGYNADETGVGRCDGFGMGRGNQGPYEYVENVYSDLPVCRYYRPNQMGFGAVQPRPYHGSEVPGAPFNPTINWIPTNTAAVHDGSAADPLTAMSIRLPFSFQVYNSRSMYQRCAHWKHDRPSFFQIDYIGSDPSFFQIRMDDESYCECTDSSCNAYKEVTSEYVENLPWILQDVWAPYGGVVCNGAKPECPCYTGKWLYCTDNNMRDGMRITADQIFELRFWASSWSSQEEYDAYYLAKPGPTRNGYADESTADIYTFKYWNKLDSTNPNESIMVGARHHMCMPAILHMREFDPSIYITRDAVEYPRIGEHLGTNLLGAEVSFPTLVRELEDPEDFIPDIVVIYPYYTTNPWDIQECNANDIPDYCIHDSNLMSDPTITIIGYTTLNKTIYVFNTEFFTPPASLAFSLMNTYVRANQIPPTQWRAFNDSMVDVIESYNEYGDGITIATSDDYGFFKISGVKIKPNRLNRLYIVCCYADSGLQEFNYRKFKVQDNYWGALITQQSAIHEHSGEIWYNRFPSYYQPGIDITGYVHSTRGTVSEVFSVYAFITYGVASVTNTYSYCINEYEDEEEDVERWTQVGATGYIWAEINNVEISYLWDFEVTEAFLTPIVNDTTGTVRVSLCGLSADNPAAVRVPLVVVYPVSSSSETLPIARRSIPPNAVLLKAENPLAFFNSDWKLTIRYSYQKLETEMINPVWPTNLDQDLSLNEFYDSPYIVDYEPGQRNFSISDVGAIRSRGSIKIMAYVTDEEGRIQTAAATKLLIQGQRLGCRSVDITYRYEADAIAYDLEPSTGFITWQGPPVVNGSSSDGLVHRNIVKCGDHECGDPNNCIGPVWFPFENCTIKDYYNVLNGAAECTMEKTENNPNLDLMGPAGWRYCTVDDYQAWVSPGGNWASACGASFYFHYSRADSTVRFTGNMFKKAKVDKWYYDFSGWELPPFGNVGREFVERFVTRDFISFLDLSGVQVSTNYEYVPMVFDKEDLLTDLNCFVTPDETTSLNEPFSSFPMMSNYVATYIDEHISENRYRFDEIIETVYHGNCMYPYPLYESVGGYSVKRYGFKNENHVWAWPEYWMPIERCLNSTHGQFKFLDIIRPEYYFDDNKVEHRLITDEGVHSIVFIPPEIPEEGEEESNVNIFPSISIDGANPRYFKIIYEDDEYTSENIVWQDESATGEENSSGGDGAEDSTGNSIYEDANNGEGLNGTIRSDSDPQWAHDFNVIFDDSASAEPNEDRKMYLGKDPITEEDKYAYYNRGLIFNIPRNRLQYLPIEESLAGNPTASTTDLAEYIGDILVDYWSFEDSDQQNIVPISVKVSGYWGIPQELYGTELEVRYSYPKIEVLESINDPVFEDSNIPTWLDDLVFASSLERSAFAYMHDDFVSYTIEFNLPRTPKRLTQTIKYFMVRVSPSIAEQIYVTNVIVSLGKYVRSEEVIYVNERKYYVGEAEFDGAYNADGPNTRSFRTYDVDMKNAGQYFPFQSRFDSVDGVDFENGGRIISKLNMVGVGSLSESDEAVDVTMSNLKEKENDVQKSLYEDAYTLDAYDTINYMGILHPAVYKWLELINANMSQATDLTMTYNKVDWEHNEIKHKLNQDGDFISTGGHYFKWSEHTINTRCYMFGPIQTVYDVDWVHYKHGGDEWSTLDAARSYAGWGRLHYCEGNLMNYEMLGHTEDASASMDSFTGAKNMLF